MEFKVVGMTMVSAPIDVRDVINEGGRRRGHGRTASLLPLQD